MNGNQPMEMRIDIGALAEDVALARDHHTKAGGLAEEKQASILNGGLWGKFVSLFLLSAEEVAANTAHRRLIDIEKAAAANVRRFVRARTDYLSGSDLATCHILEKLYDPYLKLMDTRRQLAKVVAAAQAARSALDSAEQKCDSAVTGELLDTVSKNRAWSALSTLQTSEASDALMRARHAIEFLQEASGETVQLADSLGILEFVDFAVDMVLAPGLDILSVANLFVLDDAIGDCRKARHQIDVLMHRLKESDGKLTPEIERLASNISKVEAPFRGRAEQEVPEILRPFCGTGADLARDR